MILPQNRFWTISNIFSLSRVLIVAPGIWLLFDRTGAGNWMAAGLFFLAAVTDMLDGYIARHFDQVSDWGKILDPLADKISITAVIFSLLWLGLLPVWFVVLVVMRDLIIFFGGLWIRKKTGEIPMSVMSGKIAVLTTGITILLAILPSGIWFTVFLVLSVLLLGYSFGEYSLRVLTLLKKTS